MKILLKISFTEGKFFLHKLELVNIVHSFGVYDIFTLGTLKEKEGSSTEFVFCCRSTANWILDWAHRLEYKWSFLCIGIQQNHINRLDKHANSMHYIRAPPICRAFGASTLIKHNKRPCTLKYILKKKLTL